jgi:large subunit ribosomal protein L23
VADKDILQKPVITEKATELGERHNKVVFRVASTANKYQIRQAVELAYGVKVVRVRTAILPGKLKRRGTSVGKRPNWKKALVTLAEGDKIDFFATE